MSQMPKPTFFNLADEKRERVTRAAIAEFAANEFAGANLDRIAAAAAVPKGSLYHYFDDKEDCYRYAVSSGIARAAALFERSLSRRPPRDCFDLFRRSLLFVLDLRRVDGDLALLYARAGFVAETAATEVAFPILSELAGSFHQRLVSWGMADGLIDPSIDRRAAGFLIDALSTRFHSKILLGDPQYGLSEASRRRLNAFARSLCDLLRKALATEPSGRRSMNR
jgi:AcrR family transcriptional regulator